MHLGVFVQREFLIALPQDEARSKRPCSTSGQSGRSQTFLVYIYWEGWCLVMRHFGLRPTPCVSPRLFHGAGMFQVQYYSWLLLIQAEVLR